MILSLLKTSRKPFTKTSRKGMQTTWRRPNLASALDARFKTLPFMSDDDRRVVDEAVAIAENQHQVIQYSN